MSSLNQRPANRGFRSVLRCAITHYRRSPSLSTPEPFTVLLCLTRMTLQVHPDYTSSAVGVEAQGEWADQMMYGECLSGHIYHRARLGGAGATDSVPPTFCILLRRGT